MNHFKTAIRNASVIDFYKNSIFFILIKGTNASLFVPEKAFESLIKKQIELLKKPCLLVADMVLEELLMILTKLETKVIIL